MAADTYGIIWIFFVNQLKEFRTWNFTLRVVNAVLVNKFFDDGFFSGRLIVEECNVAAVNQRFGFADEACTVGALAELSAFQQELYLFAGREFSAGVLVSGVDSGGVAVKGFAGGVEGNVEEFAVGTEISEVPVEFALNFGGGRIGDKGGFVVATNVKKTFFSLTKMVLA